MAGSFGFFFPKRQLYDKAVDGKSIQRKALLLKLQQAHTHVHVKRTTTQKKGNESQKQNKRTKGIMALRVDWNDEENKIDKTTFETKSQYMATEHTERVGDREYERERERVRTQFWLKRLN